MRILAFSDLHLHAFREFSTYADGENSRRQEIGVRLADTLKLARKKKVDVAVFAGDFYDDKSRIDVASLALARRILSDYAGGTDHPPLVFCSGTHDIGRNNCSTLVSLEGLSENFLIDVPAPDLGSYIVIPVRSAVGSENHLDLVKGAIRAYKEFDLSKEGILLTHGFVEGSHFDTPGGVGGLPESFLLENFKLAVVGHYHNPSRHYFFSPKQKSAILIPGSVIPHDFGNPNTGRCWLVDVTKERVDFEMIEFEHPRFTTVDIALTPGYVFHQDDYYRVYVPVGAEHHLPERNCLVIEREEVVSCTRTAQLEVGDSPAQLVTKYIDYLVGVEQTLPAKAKALEKIGHVLVKARTKELSDKDAEKIEEIFDAN